VPNVQMWLKRKQQCHM